MHKHAGRKSMKKIVLLTLLVLSVNSVFGQINTENLTKTLEDSGLFCFDKTEAENIQKTYITITCESAEYFTRTTRIWFNSDLYENRREMTYEDVKNAFKECNNELFGISYSNTSHYTWKDGKNFSYSIDYVQMRPGIPFDGAGDYVIRVFTDTHVYIILLEDTSDNSERNKDYDSLSDLCFYKEGQKLDISKGLERTQGYQWKSKEAIEEFYNRLRKLDSSLPESAIKFQESELYLEKILEDL